MAALFFSLIVWACVACGFGVGATPSCWCSNAFKRALDRYCGLCITALYFLYISVVKGALSVFDCSKNEDGVRILDADPSIVCDQVCVRSLAGCKLLGVKAKGEPVLVTLSSTLSL
jgi:hypothetical protein